VKLNESNKKIKGHFKNETERTSVDNIFAIGDVLDGVPELTPSAI